MVKLNERPSLGELSRSSNARSLTQKQSKHCQFLVECLAT